jgi:hypothetical protein
VFIDDLHTTARTNGHTAGKNELNKQLDAIQDCWQCSERVPAPVNAVDGDITALGARYESMPWDRLVPTANEAIEQFGLPSWLSKAKHFLVDEYQDFNPSEQKLISLVSLPSDSVIIVGDMDQSIYSGRSASPAGLRGLLERDDVTTVNFVWCRRCPRSVIGAANKISS